MNTLMWYGRAAHFNDKCIILSAWAVVPAGQHSPKEVTMTSQIDATFSVELCAKSQEPGVCQITKTHTAHVVGIAQDKFMCFQRRSTLT